jgi:K+-sensing histidine kinase KdpD
MARRDANPGFEIHDLLTAPAFLERSEHLRTPASQLFVLQRLTHVLADSPDTVLQELVEAACELCNAGSAGISMETCDIDGNPVSHWVAVTGVYAPFRNVMVPQAFMPCKPCLASQRPQLIRIPSEHFEATMNVHVPPVTEGILLPWNSDGQRATIWVVSHDSYDTFTRADYDILKVFADFASVAYRHRRESNRAVEAAAVTGADAMAHVLVRLINTPLRSLVSSLHLAREGGPDASTHAQQATDDAIELSAMINELLAIYRKQSVQ